MENKDKTFFAFIAIVIATILLKFVLECLKVYKTKEDLAKDYGVCRHTAGNWAQHFQNVMPPDTYKKKRRLSLEEFLMLKNSWGYDKTLVLNKQEIAVKANSDYKILAQMVIKKLDKIGITKEAWDQTSLFPPVISQRIIDAM